MVCTKPKKTPSCVDSGTVLMLRGPGAERTHPLLTGLPRRGVLGNSPVIKTSRIFLPLETCRCVPSAKAQGSMPRLSFSPTEAPATDIMQLLLQAQKKGRLEASYRRYRWT